MNDIGIWSQQLSKDLHETCAAIYDYEPPVANVTQPAPEPTDEEWQALTQAKSPRPTGWDGYVGNKRAVAIIQEAITAAQAQARQLPHLLLYGPAGVGKSTISRIIAESMGGKLFETTASTLETPMDVARLVFEMNFARQQTTQPSVLFIDEIHMLGQAKGRMAIDQESIYPLLEDYVFFHNLKGRSVESANSDSGFWPISDNLQRAYPFTCIGATTDPGFLNEALRRRFLQIVELQPYSEQEIATIIQGAAARLGWTISPGAASLLSRYSRRNPGRSYQLLTAAQNRAVATARPGITAEVAEEVIQRLGLFPLGLTSSDVKILTLLADRPKGMSAAEISKAAGISISTFAGVAEPFLLFLGFIQVLTRRTLTPSGVKYLASIGAVDRGAAA